MKAFLIIFSIIMFNISLVFSQVSKGFTLNITPNEYIDCEIDLYKSGEYEIVLVEQQTADMVYGILISRGNYKLDNEKIKLTDSYNGYKMLFEGRIQYEYKNKSDYKDQFVTAKKSFKFLNDKKFIKNISYISDKPISIRDEKIPLIQARLENKRIFKKEYSLKLGEYGGQQGFNLKILPNKKYQFGYKNILISEGFWDRKRNELVFYDTTLKHLFFAFIEETGIIHNFLPGQKIGNILTYSGK